MSKVATASPSHTNTIQDMTLSVCVLTFADDVSWDSTIKTLIFPFILVEKSERSHFQEAGHKSDWDLTIDETILVIFRHCDMYST